MVKNITELGPREAEFISLIASRSQKIVTTKDAIKFWGNENLSRKKLSHLEKKGWLSRIAQGKYLIIPLEAGPKRQWSDNFLLIANMLAEPACIAYWSAIRFWNWTEQLPRIIYVQTTQRKNLSQKSVLGNRFEIVTVPQSKFFGNLKQWDGDISFFVTEKEKTLVDCADNVRRCGGIVELAKAVKSAAAEINYAKLNNYISRFPNGAVKKRLGYLLETLLPDLPDEAKDILMEWQEQLSTGINPLYPGGPKSGKIVTRWRLLVNVRI